MWARLPQGLKNSPTRFDEALHQNLVDFLVNHPSLTLLQYVDDLLLAAKTEQECLKGPEFQVQHNCHQVLTEAHGTGKDLTDQPNTDHTWHTDGSSFLHQADLLGPDIDSFATTSSLQARLRALQLIQNQVWKPLVAVYQSKSPTVANTFEIWDSVYVRRHQSKTLEPHWKGLHTVLLTTPTTIKRLYDLIVGAFLALNQTDPDQTEPCWLCLASSVPPTLKE
ncbi:hypothetical protein STEG23_025836 [Scotinomys teguina]